MNNKNTESSLEGVASVLKKLKQQEAEAHAKIVKLEEKAREQEYAAQMEREKRIRVEVDQKLIDGLQQFGGLLLARFGETVSFNNGHVWTDKLEISCWVDDIGFTIGINFKRRNDGGFSSYRWEPKLTTPRKITIHRKGMPFTNSTEGKKGFNFNNLLNKLAEQIEYAKAGKAREEANSEKMEAHNSVKHRMGRRLKSNGLKIDIRKQASRLHAEIIFEHIDGELRSPSTSSKSSDPILKLQFRLTNDLFGEAVALMKKIQINKLLKAKERENRQ